MRDKKATRRCCNNYRAKSVQRDAHIVPQSDWERAMRYLPVVFGAFFALVALMEAVA